MSYQFQHNDATDPFDDVTVEVLANQQLYGVITGCAVTLDGADMTWDVATGDVVHNGKPIAVAAQANVSTIAADPSQPRWVRFYIDSSGTAGAVTGTAAATPDKPELGDNVGLLDVYVDAGLTILNNASRQFDKRAPYRTLGFQGTDIASAATLNFPASGGSYFHITGTTGVTALQDAAAGVRVGLQFDDAVTITHNATTLILRDAANYTTAAGDVLEFVSEGGGNWREVGRYNATMAALSTYERAITVEKAADETVNNSTTLQNDDDLTFTIAASKRYAVDGFFLVDSGATPDIKFSMNMPGTSTFDSMVVYRTTASATNVSQWTEAADLAAGGDGAGTPNQLSFQGVMIADGSGGTVTLQWAQNTADVSDTKLLTGSYIRYQLLN